MMDEFKEHVGLVISEMLEGRVIPFFGAGVNLCDREEKVEWHATQTKFLPSGAELSHFLADQFNYPSEDKSELARVSEYVDLVLGSAPLYLKLHSLFDHDFPPTCLHHFFANLPKFLTQHKQPPLNQLIVTTNYDDLMEQAFEKKGIEFDVVTYISRGEFKGKFIHRSPDGNEQVVRRPNEYTKIAVDELQNLLRPAILKLHGATIRRKSAESDQYVITEDHYIDYLTNTDIFNLLPVNVSSKLAQSHFLFLGYKLRDWNLRVIFHRIWRDQQLTFNSWAVQRTAHTFEKKYWNRRNVELLNLDLKTYIGLLTDELNRRFPEGN